MNDTHVTVAASYNNDGTCNELTIRMFGKTIMHEDIAEAVKLLARPRQPRPRPDTTCVLKTWEPAGVAA